MRLTPGDLRELERRCGKPLAVQVHRIPKELRKRTAAKQREGDYRGIPLGRTRVIVTCPQCRHVFDVNEMKHSAEEAEIQAT